MKKKKRVKKKNGIAKALQHPSFKHRVIPDTRKAYHVSELTKEQIQSIMDAEYPAGYKHLDEELMDD